MLSERDFNILGCIADLKFMTTTQIHLMHGYSGQYGIKVTRRKLKELEHKGWLKSWQPSKYEQKIYYLSKLGAKELEYRCDLPEIRTYRKSDKTIHQTMISDVIVRCITEGSGKLNYYHLSKNIAGIIPDAYMEYELGSDQIILLLEVDRNTESVLYLREVKLEKYRQFYRCSATNIHRPVMLIVTNSPYRKKIIGKIVHQYNLPGVCCTLEEFIVSPAAYLQKLSKKKEAAVL